MGRGKESKLRRRNRKKEEAANGGRLFGGGEGLEENGNAEDFGPSNIPLPPGMAEKDNDSDASSSDEGEMRNDAEELMMIRKKKSKASSCCDDTKCDTPPKKSSEKGIKTTPLILLVLLVGTAVLPGLIYASDIIGGFLQKNHVLGQIGFRLGIGSVPKKRVMSFYEKHDPNKLPEVPVILSKYYGEYPKLVKKLERKYQDYGYFIGWEEDEAPLTLALEQLQETYTLWINSYWNVYAPQQLKTAARNIRYNLTFLQKKFRKAWKKQIWPHLEPFLGVPKGAEKQKRQDAAEAKKRREEMNPSGSRSSGTRRRSAQYRDDVDE